MTGLTDATWSRIRQSFPPDLHLTVAEILENECGNNLPFLEDADAVGLERFHLAALELSEGSLEKLRAAVDLAKTDWRDLLVAASQVNAPKVNRWWRIRRRSRPSKTSAGKPSTMGIPRPSVAYRRLNRSRLRPRTHPSLFLG